MAQAPNTILLASGEIEAPPPDVVKAGGAITPGDLLELNSAGDVIRHATAGGRGLRVALENTPFNKGIDDDYADDDQTNVHYPRTGDKLFMFLAQGSAPVVKGDYLESHGNGKLRKLASGVALFQVEEDKNANGGVNERIRVTAL